MSRRAEKRERASYRDSRRYLKRHPPRRSSPVFGLAPRGQWYAAVQQAIHRYPELARRREADMRSGGLRTAGRGPSAEAVVMRHCGGDVAAVEAALAWLEPGQRERVRLVLWGGAKRRKVDRAPINLFCRYLAAFLGYGRAKYDLKSL